MEFPINSNVSPEMSAADWRGLELHAVAFFSQNHHQQGWDLVDWCSSCCTHPGGNYTQASCTGFDVLETMGEVLELLTVCTLHFRNVCDGRFALSVNAVLRQKVIINKISKKHLIFLTMALELMEQYVLLRKQSAALFQNPWLLRLFVVNATAPLNHAHSPPFQVMVCIKCFDLTFNHFFLQLAHHPSPKVTECDFLHRVKYGADIG